jgi:hypothetical protein
LSAQPAGGGPGHEAICPSLRQADQAPFRSEAAVLRELAQVLGDALDPGQHEFKPQFGLETFDLGERDLQPFGVRIPAAAASGPGAQPSAQR